MVTKLTYGSGLGEGLSSFGSTLGSAIQKAGQKRLEEKESNVLQEVIGSMPENPTAMDIMGAYSKVPASQRKGFTEVAKLYEKTQASQGISSPQKAIENMLDTVKHTGPVAATGMPFKPQTRLQRQYFDTLALQLERLAADMVGKGTLNKERFKFLKATLPSSNKTQAANIGALKAWAEDLNLDIPGLDEAIKGQGQEKKTAFPTREKAKGSLPPINEILG